MRHGRRARMVEHIEAAREVAAEAGIRMDACQIFVAGPRTLVTTLDAAEADELRGFVAANPGFRLICHATYLSSPWGGNWYLARFILAELELAASSGARGLVIHLGKPPLAEVLDILPRLLRVPPCEGPLLYLETPHTLPRNANYVQPEQLEALFTAIRRLDPELRQFGLCIDTAHLWSSGVPIGDFAGAQAWLEGLEERTAHVLPPSNMILHLNDSYDDCGSGVDHHAPLLQGKLWGGYSGCPANSGLCAFLDWARRVEVPIILERPGGPGQKGAPPPGLLDDYSVLYRLVPELRVP